MILEIINLSKKVGCPNGCPWAHLCLNCKSERRNSVKSIASDNLQIDPRKEAPEDNLKIDPGTEALALCQNRRSDPFGFPSSVDLKMDKWAARPAAHRHTYTGEREMLELHVGKELSQNHKRNLTFLSA